MLSLKTWHQFGMSVKQGFLPHCLHVALKYWLASTSTRSYLSTKTHQICYENQKLLQTSILLFSAVTIHLKLLDSRDEWHDNAGVYRLRCSTPWVIMIFQKTSYASCWITSDSSTGFDWQVTLYWLIDWFITETACSMKELIVINLIHDLERFNVCQSVCLYLQYCSLHSKRSFLCLAYHQGLMFWREKTSIRTPVDLAATTAWRDMFWKIIDSRCTRVLFLFIHFNTITFKLIVLEQ